MMGTQFRYEAVEDTQESEIHLCGIPIKLEHENEARNAQYDSHPVPADELEALVKVEPYSSDDNDALENIVKSELLEFHNNENSDDSNQNGMETALLENIPKTETNFICGDAELSNSSSEVGNLYDIRRLGTNDDSDSDLERDPFEDIDSDPNIPKSPQSYISTVDSAAQDELLNQAGVSHSSTRSFFTKKKLLTTATSKHGLQRRTLPCELQCQLCLETQSSKDQLNTHLENCAPSHKNIRRFCVPCNKLFSRAQKLSYHALKKHGIKNVDLRPFKCGICPKTFVHRESYVAHSVLHETSSTAEEVALNLKPFKCPQCNSRFTQVGGLTKHVSSHENERRFKCPMPNCEKAFNVKDKLRLHLTRSHSEERRFMCQEPNCGKAFKIRDELQKHMACHLVDRPFKCPHSECDRAFKRKEYLTSHLAAHMGARRYKDTEDRPFQCEQCGRVFCKNWLLTKHLRTHSNHVLHCPQPNCESTFKHQHSLQVHLATIHTTVDSVQFKCSVPNCDKEFKTDKRLKEHIRSHTRPNKCTEPGCSASFPRPNLLNSHMLSKHPKKEAKETRD